MIRFWSNLIKKDSVESAKYDIQFLLQFLNFLGVFFMDLDPDFPDRIRTQETKSDRDLDPEKKDPDPKNCRPDHPHLGGHLEYLDDGLLV